MDELEKLFAEASASVKRVTKGEPEPAKAPEPEPVVLEVPKAVEPAPRPAPPQAMGSREPFLAKGGEQSAESLRVEGPEGEATIPWNAIGNLRLGRVEGTQYLGFLHQSRVYYFGQSEVAYKGLLSRLQPSTVANWRALVLELAEHVGTSADPGVEALSTGTGVVPKYDSLPEFLARVRSA